MTLAGNLRTLLGLVILITLVYLIYNYFISKKYHLSKLEPASKAIVIEGSKLPVNKGAANYSYSIWFYVNDWGVDLAKTKPLLIRGKGGVHNPSITLAPYENNINIMITTYPTKGGSDNSSHSAANLSSTHPCTVRNFPLQKWVNLIVSLNGRTLDVYIDGKLVRTCILPGVAKVDPNANINITPGGGFNGYTSNLQYFAYPLNPQEAYNIYKEGPGTSRLFGFFDKYQLKISYLVDNQEKGSISI